MTNFNIHDENNTDCTCVKCERKLLRDSQSLANLADENVINFFDSLLDFEPINQSLNNENFDGGFSNNIPFEKWDKVLIKAQPGDLIEIDRGWYRHWALFEGGASIIHLKAYNGEDFELCDLINKKVKTSRQNVSKESSDSETPFRYNIKNKLREIFPDSNFVKIITSPFHYLSGSLSPSFNSNYSVSEYDNENSNSGARPTPTFRDALVGTTALLARDSIALTAGQSLIRINNKEMEARVIGVYPPLPPAQVLENAKMMLFKEVPYNLLKNNCEHYVTRWKFGPPGWSTQTRETTIKICEAAQSFCHTYKTSNGSMLPSLKKAFQKYRETRQTHNHNVIN